MVIDYISRYLTGMIISIKRLVPSINIRFLVTATSLFFVFLTITSNREKLLEVQFNRFVIAWLLLGILISFISVFVNAIAWRSLLIWLGCRHGQIDEIRLFVSSNLLKYLPGGVWHLVERIRVARRYIGLSQALSSVLLEPFLMVSAALLFVPLAGWQSGLALCCFIPAMLFIPVFREPLFGKFERFKFAQLKKLDSSNTLNGEMVRFGTGRADYPCKALLIELFFILFRFGGFWACLNAFSLPTSLTLGQLLAAFALAWSIGLVVPGAPGGLGVFEAAILLRIGSIEPEASLLLALLCYRIIITIADVIAAIFVTGNKNIFALRTFK